MKIDYPAVYIAYCKHFKLNEKLEKYVTECMSEIARNDPLKYATYIHGGILPTLEKERQTGMLKYGKCYPKELMMIAQLKMIVLITKKCQLPVKHRKVHHMEDLSLNFISRRKR